MRIRYDIAVLGENYSRACACKRSGVGVGVYLDYRGADKLRNALYRVFAALVNKVVEVIGSGGFGFAVEYNILRGGNVFHGLAAVRDVVDYSENRDRQSSDEDKRKNNYECSFRTAALFFLSFFSLCCG